MSGILNPNGTVERFLVLVIALAAVIGIVWKVLRALNQLIRTVDKFEQNVLDTTALKNATDLNTQAIKNLTDIIQRNGLK
jgi:hypothetical protein